MSEVRNLLRWGNTKDGETTYTPFGVYSVEQREDGQWYWGYFFVEYYDESQIDCESLEIGKALAQADWDMRLLPILDNLSPTLEQGE